MEHDVVIVGAGLSGLAAGIRLAHYGKRVCIVERHTRIGGLNSYYYRRRRLIDVGLHALTNFCDARVRSAPLNRLLRQLRLRREQLQLAEQNYSVIAFPQAEMRFTNDVDGLISEVGRCFPDQESGFRQLVQTVRDHDALSLSSQWTSTRSVLRETITDPMLRDMLFCPVMYYGNAVEHDMDFDQFCIMFQSIFLEGFCRPAGGVRRILDLLEERYLACGGELRMGCGVRQIRTGAGELKSLVLDDDTVLEPGAVLSSAGYVETLRLCDPTLTEARSHAVGQIGFVESIFVLDTPAHDLGHDATIVFFSEFDEFRYARATELVDTSSGVLCAPTNFGELGTVDADVPQLRLTHRASPEHWAALSRTEYRDAKARILDAELQALEATVPGVSAHVVDRDMFTPCTVQRYTGHINGAVYGSPAKHRDGTTPVGKLFICGTDQGFLGIVGAMLSGVSMANYHLLK